jgi:hypothetical protein
MKQPIIISLGALLVAFAAPDAPRLGRLSRRVRWPRLAQRRFRHHGRSLRGFGCHRVPQGPYGTSAYHGGAYGTTGYHSSVYGSYGYHYDGRTYYWGYPCVRRSR